MVADDRQHALSRRGFLFGRQGTQVAGGHATLWNHVGLAEDLAGGARGIVLDGGAGQHQTCVEGQVLLFSHFAPEAVENAGDLEACPVADVFAEDQR
jgi:hypothetical protein